MNEARINQELRRRVLDELAWDSLVPESQLDVEVSDEVITLVGTVGSLAEKLAAQEAAQAVTGVHDLVNEIDVKPLDEQQPSDDELQAMAESVLAWDALVPEQDLTVSVSSGGVTLAGLVAVAAQRAEAERAVGRLAGVKAVTNRITVGQPDLTPSDVRAAIEEALRRRASHRAARIDVSVDGATVTLAGAVQTQLEKRAVIGAVSHAPGIEAVRDELRIDPLA